MFVSRRDFIIASLATSAVAAGGSSGCGNDVRPAPIVNATIDDDPTSTRYGQIEIVVPRYPDLDVAGGAIALKIAPLGPGTRPFIVPATGVLLVHRGTVDDPPEFVATRADCPHQGCPLGYSAKDKMIECPCHGSRFRAVADVNDPTACAGLVTHLPAKSNLAVYGATRVGDSVFVDLNKDLSCDAMSGFPSVVDGKVTLPFSQFPDLMNVGGNVIGKPSGLNDKLLVARVTVDKLIVVSAFCSHAQCDLQFVLDGMELYCACHGSEYELDGKVRTGPSTTALTSYPVTFDGAMITIEVA